jgi:hypothetical protein
MTRTTLAAVVLMIATSATAMAGQIDHRERRQAHRIFNGVQSGELTFNEFRQLARGQARVHLMERRARADGFVDPWERNRIRQAQDVQSGRIYNKKHN